MTEQNLDQILEGPDYFLCERLACKLRVEVCLKRQQKNLSDSGFLKEFQFPRCVDCAQGVINNLSQKSGGLIMTDNLKATEKEGKEIPVQSKNTRLCECGRLTLSPNCPYCPSCMSKKSRTDKEKKEEPSKKDFKEGKEGIKSPLIAPETPVQLVPGNSLLIDFSSHDNILRGIEKLAEEEVRPVGLQIIYILKSYLKSLSTV